MVYIKKLLLVFSSFVIMLCLGGVYAWSIVASELIKEFNYTIAETQLVFGTLIAIFPLTMIFVGHLAKRLTPRFLGYISAILFITGYLLAAFSKGHFFPLIMGIGVLAGIGTGIGYWICLMIPVQCFPKRKGSVTGIAAAGFGLGAVFLSMFIERLLESFQVLSVLMIIGVSYGLVILFFSNFISWGRNIPQPQLGKRFFLNTMPFYRLFLGILLGTFAGLLIIGSLKLIGEYKNISSQSLLLAVSLFAVANFLGRLFWGFICDYINTNLVIFFSLAVQAVSILFLDIGQLSNVSYLVLSFFVGFGFGGNFVLFAKETAQLFGINNLGIIYPFVLLGYAVAGILGPFAGGLMYGYTASFTLAIQLASFLSLFGALIYLFHYLKVKSTYAH